MRMCHVSRDDVLLEPSAEACPRHPSPRIGWATSCVMGWQILLLSNSQTSRRGGTFRRYGSRPEEIFLGPASHKRYRRLFCTSPAIVNSASPSIRHIHLGYALHMVCEAVLDVMRRRFLPCSVELRCCSMSSRLSAQHHVCIYICTVVLWAVY